MALPNFLGIGAQKAGTTPLADLLRQHPDVYLHPLKEVHFFYWARGHTASNSYEYTLFANYGGQQLIGEISPEYMRVPNAARLAREKLGRIKIIVCLREPTARAFSHYLHCLRAAEDNRPFLSACVADAAKPLWSDRNEDISVAYVRGSRYAYQIEEWEREFGRENMFYCVVERDLSSSKAKVDLLKRLFAFLELSTRGVRINLNVPSSSAPAPKITFAQTKGVLNVTHGTGGCDPGDIIVEAGSFRRIVRRPSPHLRLFFERMARDMTPTLSAEARQLVHQTYFADVADRVSAIIRQDVTGLWIVPEPAVPAAASG